MSAIEAVIRSTNERESKTGGLVRTVTLELGSEGTHPFRGMIGQRIAFAVALIADDEEQHEVVDHAPSECVSCASEAGGEGHDKPQRRIHEMPRSQQAGMLCRDGTFRGWIGIDTEHPEAAKFAVYQACGVTTLTALDDKFPDEDNPAGKRWDALHSRYRQDMGWETEQRS